MRTKQTLIITLPEPCHESWDEMKTVGCGRFCGQCEKTVIDFTEMTDDEVIRIMTKSAVIPCGRFKETQLNRAMLIPEEKHVKPFPRIISKVAASLLLLQTLVSNSFGQKQEKVLMVQTSNNHNSNDTSKEQPLVESKIIKGHVFDNVSKTIPKEGLIGATVKLVGTDISTQTDFDGNFEIEIPAGSIGMLELSCYGYITQTAIAVDGMVVALPAAPSIDYAVVVTQGFAAAKKYNTYSAKVVMGARKIESIPIADLIQPIESNNSIVPIENKTVSGSSLTIRGGECFVNAIPPLIILDGVPYKGDLTSINPMDVIKMDILKDAMATSLYGSKGANGVIVITTKNGKPKSGFWNFFKRKRN